MRKEIKTIKTFITKQDELKCSSSVSLFDTDIYWKAEEYVCSLKENKN